MDKSGLPFSVFSRFYDVREGIVSASKRERGVWLAESPPFGAVYHRSIYSRSEAARKKIKERKGRDSDRNKQDG